MDADSLITNIIITAISGTAFGGLGTFIVGVMKNRSERRVYELQATSKVKQEENATAIEAWKQIHERDEKEKAELHRMYREDIATFKAEITQLRAEVKSLRDSESECDKRQAVMATELKMIKENILPQLMANNTKPPTG